MDPSLAAETEKLARSWLRHEAGMLRDYLVSGVEDPRINLQSVLSRHFILRELTGSRFAALMAEECRFAAAMNCLIGLAARLRDPEEPGLVLHALRQGGDNAEGIEFPQFLAQSFALLPSAPGASDTTPGLERLPYQASPGSTPPFTVPNYIERFLSGLQFSAGRARVPEEVLDTFSRLWSRALAPLGRRPEALRVLEPACGSANDFHFLHACGIARLLNYTGFDLCPTDVANARTLFPGIRFEVANVFEIPAEDKGFDLTLVQDLFEHLSPAGIERAVAEICRVTRRGVCAGFFNLDEIGEHQVQPVEEYYWNRLSMARMRASFAAHGFTGQVVHIGTWLREEFGCEETHNDQAYTFVLSAASGGRQLSQA